MRPRLPLLAAALALALPAVAAAKDLSAESMGDIADLLAPYRGAEPPLGAQADPAAVRQALGILAGEKLLDPPRPARAPLGVAEKLGRALALGARTSEFLPEVGAVRDALVRQDEPGARSAIQDLYGKMGRTRPEGPALDPLYSAARDAVGAEPQETESASITRPDYSILVENARAAGQARVAVLMNQGPDGQPARVEFKGDVTSRPAASGQDLETAVEPAPAPETMTSAQAAEVRDRINGRWRDQDGTEYEISGEGGAILVRELRPGKAPRDYTGTFRLGQIDASFPIAKPDDMSEGLPLEVRQQLAGMGLHFDLSLEAVEAGAKLEGTWASQHVTYSSDNVVSQVHDPYDVETVLTRGGQETEEGADADEQP